MLSIALPPPKLKGDLSAEEAILRRRSVRRYRSEPLTLPQLSQVLWAAQGLTDKRRGLRAVPSAGATYPLEVFVLAGKNGVAGLKEGVYHYDAEEHTLNLNREGDRRGELASASLNQGFIREAPVDIVVCAVYERASWRYGRRAERYVHMEVGHVGQNIHLQAEALGLATVMVGAFHDQTVGKVLGAKEEVKPLYIMPLGKPQERG
ncbi:MAG: SagB/ThcOx family dehydrogenase [Dehalococcoidia bacterium]